MHNLHLLTPSSPRGYRCKCAILPRGLIFFCYICRAIYFSEAGPRGMADSSDQGESGFFANIFVLPPGVQFLPRVSTSFPFLPPLIFNDLHKVLVSNRIK